MFAAMGTEARLRIMRLLLSAHPEGMIVGDIQAELGIPNSTLSHHLEKLRSEGLVKVRQARFISLVHRGYGSAAGNTDVFIRGMLHANKAITPESIVQIRA